MIEVPPKGVLLEIFGSYTMAHGASSRVSMSRRWRCIVFTSQRGLDLRLFCTHNQYTCQKDSSCLPALLILTLREFKIDLLFDTPVRREAFRRNALRVSYYIFGWTFPAASLFSTWILSLNETCTSHGTSRRSPSSRSPMRETSRVSLPSSSTTSQWSLTGNLVEFPLTFPRSFIRFPPPCWGSLSW
ncbi:hypothetical protein BJY52DRAFT_1278166 [Lactarius psammicola]|nr:hypothetical protein BJY52DRAFT_1278166 [Lactarius psammicola]